jgi:hypothetical protein
MIVGSVFAAGLLIDIILLTVAVGIGIGVIAIAVYSFWLSHTGRVTISSRIRHYGRGRELWLTGIAVFAVAFGLGLLAGHWFW